MDNCYPGTYRLRKNWEYKQVKQMGCKFNTPHFVLLVYESNRNCDRLGITVTRKVGNAVQRNRIKRLVREFFRTNKQNLSQSNDYSVIAKRSTARLSNHNIFEALNGVFFNTVKQ